MLELGSKCCENVVIKLVGINYSFKARKVKLKEAIIVSITSTPSGFESRTVKHIPGMQRALGLNPVCTRQFFALLSHDLHYFKSD